MLILTRVFEDMQNIVKEDKLLLLWSWQWSPDFSLTEGTVDHSRSKYCKTVRGVPKSYKELSERLGTDQFVWCYTRQDDHTMLPGAASVEWRLEVPKHSVLALICSVAWHWIVARNGRDDNSCVIPQKFIGLWQTMAPCGWREFKKGFHNGWRSKTPQQLWDALFLDEVEDECTHVLLRHPVKKEWIKNVIVHKQ